LDPTFGDGGKVLTSFRGMDAWIGDVAIQSDGKIVAVGSVAVGDGTYDFAVCRYLPDGSLDASFGDAARLRYSKSSRSSRRMRRRRPRRTMPRMTCR